MTLRIPPGKSHLLLVEGKDDKEFFIRLGCHLRFDESTPIHIEKYCGVDNLGKFLRGLLTHPNFAQLRRIGIVRDADFGDDAFQSVKDTIINAIKGKSRRIGIPKRVMELSDGSPAAIVLVLPADGREGMLEDLIMDVLHDDPVTACVETFFDCVNESVANILDHKLSKAKLRAFVTGKNVCENVDGDDSEKLYLTDVYRMSWWKPEFWDHPAFDEAKAFITQFLAP